MSEGASADQPSPPKLKATEEMLGRCGLPFLGEILSIFGDEELYY